MEDSTQEQVVCKCGKMYIIAYGTCKAYCECGARLVDCGG